jgi:hypothetical protein
MRRDLKCSFRLAIGCFLLALPAFPQAYTISARPGIINFVEGKAFINSNEISSGDVGRKFLTSNDSLSTAADGKVEVLLTPGVYLRMGPESEARMVSPSLTNTQLEMLKGSSMIEVNELQKDVDIQVMSHGAAIHLEKTGLYRVSADAPPMAAVFDGKASVQMNDKKVSLGKNRQTVLSADLKSEKFKVDKDSDDPLYAWSKRRDEYSSAATYASVRTLGGGLSATDLAYGYGGLGYTGYGVRPGWFWNSGFNSWAWLPGTGAFYSPFGFGFFSPAYAMYAPLVYGPIYGRPGRYAVPVNPGRGSQAFAGTTARPPLVTGTGTRFGSAQRSVLSGARGGAAPVGVGPGRSMGQVAAPRSVAGPSVGARSMGGPGRK